MKTSWKSGEWKAICDQCGRQGYASQMRQRWDGLMVHADPHMGCWEPRHPQEFVRGVKDQIPLPWTRPDRDLNSLGLPQVSAAPALNCAYLGFTYLNKAILEAGTQTVRKVSVTGPLTINGTITVECTLEIT